MDKYEFNIKVEQIQKMVNKGDYATAMKIADTIDWKRVRNASLLSMISQVYEKNAEYQDAKDVLLLAFERAPIGKRFLYKLTELALKNETIDEAETYYREFCDLAGDDSRQYLLRYMILKAKEAPIEQQIHALEKYTSEELDEKWMYELAELYHKAGDADHCVSTCDKIMLMFGLGKYVDCAMDLKRQYAPLTSYQMDLVENREKYEAKLRAVEQSFQENEEEFYSEKDMDEEKTPEVMEVRREEPEPVAEVEEDVETSVQEISGSETSEQKPEAAALGTEASKDDEVGTKVEENVISEEEAEDQDVVEEEPKPGKMKNHLMIEARTPEKGLELALDTLRKIQRETGIKNPVAKITGSKLNEKGILANAEKLSGKDLMIEEAGDLSQETIKELEQFMSGQDSEIRVILIDNPRQMESLHAKNPSLASHFECIASPDAFKKNAAEGEKDASNTADRVVNDEKEQKPEVDDRPVRQITPVRDSAMRAPDKSEFIQKSNENQEDDDEELDIDEFAQYACKYAAEIDCSVTGKSMLALYERIEIMEEDGIPLTRANAEALIEETADKAEKPGIRGLFSSKYNKEGKLILKEEHFIS